MMIRKEESKIRKLNKERLQLEKKECFIIYDTVAIDAIHFESRDQVPPKEDKQKRKYKA